MVSVLSDRATTTSRTLVRGGRVRSAGRSRPVAEGCSRAEGRLVSAVDRATWAKSPTQQVRTRSLSPTMQRTRAYQCLPSTHLHHSPTVAALADADPLGVPSDISFDSVGGMGGHIQQLKEMVSLPLLYPEVFERFKITPPRGVLFHGPPGTGKTLLARALAASCSTDGRKICECSSACREPESDTSSKLTICCSCLAAFFMRKGADCLSKWVGEAERQLRLLFEEAKACQPSIIFFDEIDGEQHSLWGICSGLSADSPPSISQDLPRCEALSRTRSTPQSCQRCSL